MLGFAKSNYEGYRQDFGVYRALVINNNDTTITYSGRVQVFIPEIHGVNLQQFLGNKSTINFRFPGNNIETDLNAASLNYLRTLCPWAVACLPVIGETGPGLYNTQSGAAGVSENPFNDLTKNTPDKAATPAAA